LHAFQLTMGLFLLCCIASYLYFLLSKRHNSSR
jgi:hypothetical protein